MKWRLLKSKNETPCCRQTVRVKTVEPGPQLRRCPICKAYNWFVLEPSTVVLDGLRFRWMTSGQVDAMLEAWQEGIAEGLDVKDL